MIFNLFRMKQFKAGSYLKGGNSGEQQQQQQQQRSICLIFVPIAQSSSVCPLLYVMRMRFPK